MRTSPRSDLHQALSPEAHIGRRRFFRIGGVAATTAIVATAAPADTATAATGTMQYGTSMSAGDAATSVSSTHNYQTLYLENSAGARALFAVSAGAGDAPAVTAQIAGATNPGPALYAENYGTGMGVFAHAFNGSPGVRGISHSASGVMGDDGGNGTGPGVTAHVFNAGNSSNALVATTAGSGSAISATGQRALEVHGAVTFSRSGRTVISYPSRAASVSVPGASLTSSSMVLATLQNHIDRVYVESAVAMPGTSTVIITLSRAPGTLRRPASVTVAWFVIG